MKERVRVFSGDMSTVLGYGYWVDNVDVYVYELPDGRIMSNPDAEKKPDTLADEIIQHLGAKPVVVKNNPKIEMDDGTIVYGCQVWFEQFIGMG